MVISVLIDFTATVGPDAPAHENAGQCVGVKRAVPVHHWGAFGVGHAAARLARLMRVLDGGRLWVDGHLVSLSWANCALSLYSSEASTRGAIDPRCAAAYSTARAQSRKTAVCGNVPGGRVTRYALTMTSPALR